MLELIANEAFIAVHGWRVWEVTESWREDVAGVSSFLVRCCFRVKLQMLGHH